MAGRTSAFERDMDAERRHHLDLDTEALVARDMTPARRAAAIDPIRALRAD